MHFHQKKNRAKNSILPFFPPFIGENVKDSIYILFEKANSITFLIASLVIEFIFHYTFFTILFLPTSNWGFISTIILEFSSIELFYIIKNIFQ